MSNKQQVIDDRDELYLPDFCGSRNVFVIVVIAELVAIILTLARSSAGTTFWTDLAKHSMFLLWLGLASAAVLCVARPRLRTATAVRVTVVSLILLLATTAIISDLAYWLGQWVDTSGLMLPSNRGQFLFQNLAISSIVSVMVLRYLYVTHQWKRNVEMEAKSRIQALQARIRPHFLFNSLNTIASLTRSNPAMAEEAIEDLADLFRANLSERQERITIKEELEVARMYQRIEELRLGKRLHVVWDIDDVPLRARIPSLTVQPLLENAIYHGIEPQPEGGTVTVSGRVIDNWIEFSITNPLPADDQLRHREGNRVALANISQRLELAYEDRAEIDVAESSDQFRVTLRFPNDEATT